MSLHRRLKVLEGRAAPEQPSAQARSEARAHMRAYLDEIAAARREERAPHEEAVAVMEAIKRRRARES